MLQNQLKAEITMTMKGEAIVKVAKVAKGFRTVVVN